jgi:REP element-mobilizing transposase RayT
MPQSLAKVYIHAIFSTKNREPMLADDWRDELFHVLGGTANNLGCQSLIVGGVADHVHLLFQLGRTITIAEWERSNRPRRRGSIRRADWRCRSIGRVDTRRFR